ncbi:YjbH domain-containing protein [Porticoccaceae bacterium]|nr:YjbH domain-containing protein [Porticoccaceae bacterium]
MASDFGTTGLIDIPTARMSSDGTLTTTAAIQSRTKAYSITYQATPWLEGTFRYTGFNRAIYSYDRNYEAKIRLWEEQRYLPQVAIGIRDLVGTGVWGSEYVVASKEMGNFDVTLGMGWGRLAGKGDFENPMTWLSDTFSVRDSDTGLGGELSTGDFFSGKEVGLFGGISYDVPGLPLTAMMEYNPDQYDFSFQRGGERPKSPITAAVKWDALPGVSLTLSHQHNEEWGIELSAALDTKSLPAKPSSRVFRSSLDYPVDELPAGINPLSWYDTLLFDVERSGILLLEATLDETSHSATIVMGNLAYPVWADAVAIMANLADLHLPTTVNTFNIVIEEEGHRLHSIRMRRPSLTYGQIGQLVESEIRVQPIKPLSFVQHRTDFVQKKIFFDVNLSNRLQLFDPDDPARYQLYAKVGVSSALPKSWLLTGAYGLDITNNFDESNRINSGSVLPRVRSDVVKYLTEGDTGLDSLYLEKRGTAMNDIHYRVFGGVLESMFSGFGGEVLYQPYQSRLAYGLSANWVQQRDYDKSFKHLDYKTSTAFASMYWATPFYNFDVAVHAGKYLAKDVGATLEVRRTFHNGWSVGLWATKTDVSAEDFGEGSFDKGMYFRIPFNGLLGTSSRSNYSMRLRPIQRDGGQRLEDFSANIWWDTRGARYDAFSEMTKRLSP